MAKKPFRKAVDADYDAALIAFTATVSGKLHSMGAQKAAGRFLSKAKAAMRRSRSRHWFDKYLAAGGDPGDMQTFIQYLIDHMDEIIAMISKLIALFTTALLLAMYIASLLPMPFC
jgi:hypothetical protein